MVLAKATPEGLCLALLLKKMDVLQEYGPVKIFGDNQDAKYHFIRDALHNGNINIIYCPTTDTLADIITKSPTQAKLKRKNSKEFYSDFS